MGNGKWAACVTVVAALTACKAADKSAENREQTAAQRRAENVIVGAKIAAPRAGPANEWPMPGADYSNSRYSELAQITPANAKNLRAAWTLDRKSTRLNSSHRCISYAVFCLK